MKHEIPCTFPLIWPDIKLKEEISVQKIKIDKNTLNLFDRNCFDTTGYLICIPVVLFKSNLYSICWSGLFVCQFWWHIACEYITPPFELTLVYCKVNPWIYCLIVWQLFQLGQNNIKCHNQRCTCTWQPSKAY